MNIKEAILESKLSANDIVQFMDYKKFIDFIDRDDASWQDYKNAEMFAIEYRDLKDSKFIKKYEEVPVQNIYRKRYSDRDGVRDGVVLLINETDKKIKQIKKEARENLVISGFSFQLKERRA